MSEPFWVTAFLDFAPEDFDRGVAYWQAVTGYAPSPSRGEHDEFATLVPPTGDDHLRVQRLGAGPSRVHLDLHVADPTAAAAWAERLGARTTARPGPGYVVLESPGGFPFCYVSHVARVRAQPATWSEGVASVVDQMCLDIPAGEYDAECAFWQELTGWELRRTGEEFSRLARPEGLAVQLLLQRLGEPRGRVRGHLDLACTDRRLETARHERLGGRVVEVRDTGWTVLCDPVGTAYCITDRRPQTGVRGSSPLG